LAMMMYSDITNANIICLDIRNIECTETKDIKYTGIQQQDLNFEGLILASDFVAAIACNHRFLAESFSIRQNLY